jgi:transposase
MRLPPGFPTDCVCDTDTGEIREQRLEHREEAERFYRDLGTQRAMVRVGMEASGHARWFERMLSALRFELWIGDAAEIRAKRVRKQKTDRQDARLILKLMLKDECLLFSFHKPSSMLTSSCDRRNAKAIL